MISSTVSIEEQQQLDINYTYVTTDNYEDFHEYQKEELNLFYAICEVLVAIIAVVGNALVILVFRKERRLRRRTNYYIVSLAAADFFVGLLGIPFAIMASVGLPTNLYACLFTVSLLVVLCTISIFCLVAVSVDRYWAILHPMGYSRNVRTKTALVIISVCWFAGTVVGFLPLMGWHKGPAENGRCFFLGVMDYNYLVFLYFGTIITPALLLAVFYAHIYHVVLKQLRQIVTIHPEKGKSTSGRTTGGTMLRMLGASQKREVKATQNLSIIVLFFMICWLPLYTINCVLAFCKDCKINSTFMLFCIILSHLNSAGNPLLYAYHLKDFRAALKAFICGLFGYGITPQSPPNYGINNNFTHYRLQSLREARSAMSLSQNKLINESQFAFGKPRSHTLPTPPKISALVNTSLHLAAATAEANRDIWRISEISEELIRDEALKPMRRSLSESNSVAFMDDYDEDDDVFLADVNYDTNKSSDLVIPVVKIQKLNNLSTSSPQLSRNVFLVETELKEYTYDANYVRSISDDKTCETPVGNNASTLHVSGDFIHSPAKTLKLSPFKVMGDLLKGAKPPRSSSLSEDPYSNDCVRHRNGFLPENHSFGS